MPTNIKLKNVTKNDYEFLFIMLKERDSKVNISHKKIPTFQEHTKFVKSKPYSHWYVIIMDGLMVGSIYLSKQNEIGIFIKKDFQRYSIGKNALQILMKKHPRKRFLANTSPKNIKSIDFFKKNGFSLIQYTYELEN
jgi:RimJ/RimL family protein N-acetyltransferase